MTDVEEPQPSLDVAALIGSRICHDLISPLGAIGNGLELLQMSGAVNGPEMALISESVDSANARIRFFRIAYGDAQTSQMIKGAELRAALHGTYQSRRVTLHWQPEDMLRMDAKQVFLGLQCMETAMPYGGTLSVSVTSDGTRITGTAERFAYDPALWDGLSRNGPWAALRPAQVQFALLAETADRVGRKVTVTKEDTTLSLAM